MDGRVLLDWTPTGDHLPLLSMLPRSKAIPTRNWRRQPRTFSRISIRCTGRWRSRRRTPPAGSTSSSATRHGNSSRARSKPFFKQHKPAIAAMTSETRKKAIANLEESDPPLFARWKTYQALQGRLAHYAKTCGRYTRTGKEDQHIRPVHRARRPIQQPRWPHRQERHRHGRRPVARLAAIARTTASPAGDRHRQPGTHRQAASSLRSHPSNDSASSSSAQPRAGLSKRRC